MLNNQVRLTICLPTYNRANFIKNQLEFFEDEIKADSSILNKVKFIVGNNASIDNTSEVLSDLQQKNPFFELVENSENMGLVGNIINLLNLSYSEYVWFVSDDDDLKKGIINEILRIIANYTSLEFIFLNYLISNEKGYNGDYGYLENSKEIALTMFDEAYGSLVFMTSCIHKRNNLLEISDHLFFNKISGPLFYSFYSCTKGPIYVTKKAWVVFRPGNASYKGLKSFLKIKFEEYLPILEHLHKFGYEKEETYKVLRGFIDKQSHSFFLYFFVNPLKAFRIAKYIRLNTLFLIPRNIITYLKR